MIEVLEDGHYWVRCVYTDREGEITSYLIEHLVDKKLTPASIRQYVTKYIQSEGGKDLGEITFRRSV